MKKLYFLATLCLSGLTNLALAQYTATNSGNWSSPITWAPGAQPSTNCNNCVITINANVTVTLDVHITLTGSSSLRVGNDLSSPSQIIINNSNPATSFAAGYNIVMDTLPGTSRIILNNPLSKIDASNGGTYDGVFAGPLLNTVYQKIIGNSPSLFLFNSIIGTSTPRYQTLSGPVVLFSGGSLPVVMTNFNAQLSNHNVALGWTTEQEVNSDHFDVQRSADGNVWKPIGRVAARGVSNAPVNYSFSDLSPMGGVNYYRILFADRDGRYVYSEVKIVSLSPARGVRIFPNPAKNYVSVTLGNDITTDQILRLTSLTGEVLQEKLVSNGAGTTHTFVVNNYPQGIYLLQVKAADGSQQTFKVLVNR